MTAVCINFYFELPLNWSASFLGSPHSAAIRKAGERGGFSPAALGAANAGRTGASCKYLRSCFENNQILTKLFYFQIENKYKLEAKNIRNIYKRCKKGYVQLVCDCIPQTIKYLFPLSSVTVQMDDDMVKHYSHEDTVLLEVHQIDTETHDITLVEYDAC